MKDKDKTKDQLLKEMGRMRLRIAQLEGRETARKKSEEALRKSEERYRILVERNPYGIQEIDTKGTIIFANAMHHKMYGYEEGGLPGRSIADFLVPGSQRDNLPGYLEILVKDQPPPTLYHQRILKKDGKERAIEVSWNYLRDPKGCVTGFISVLTDITERKRAEEERLELEKQLQHTQKLESLGVLAGGIAHDFNNLLTGMLGNAELALLKMSPTSPARDYVKNIRKAVEGAADLTNQMLDYSGKGQFLVEPVSLNALVEDMAHLLRVSISKKSTLRYDLSEDLPAVEAGVAQLRQVIMNLITNASEAHGDRSGTITVSTGLVEAGREYFSDYYRGEALPEGRYVYLEVSDTGCGMSEETRSKLFEPFFTTKFTGRGLGMSAVLGIVRGHQGAIRVYSEEGRGSSINILLPASEKLAADPSRPEPAMSDGWKGEGTILVVDDEKGVRNTAAMLLKELGFKVLLAEDGEEGIRTYKSHQDGIVAVLLDMTMPRMNGEETFDELRKISKDVKVILSSGYSEQDATASFAGKGLAGFIQKPYLLEKLREKLRSLTR